eukprot:scaffold60127_cov55-Attheya_sp.AAC.2
MPRTGGKDRYDAGHASAYEPNLVHLIQQLRIDFDAPHAKFVCATLGQTPKEDDDVAGTEGQILQAQLAVDGSSGKYSREFEGNVATNQYQPKTVNWSNNGFQEVSRCRGGGRSGGYGHGDSTPGRGPPGRGGRGGKRNLKEKGDKPKENEENKEKVDAGSNGDEEMDNDEELEEYEDGVEEYEEEKEELVEDPKESRRVFQIKKEFGPRFLRNSSTEESVLAQGC